MAKNVIQITENDLHQMVQEALNIIQEGMVANTTNSVDDIAYLILNDRGDGDKMIDGEIYNGKYYDRHPLMVEVNITKEMLNPAGLSYRSWVTNYLYDDELQELQNNGVDLNNPPTGFCFFEGFEKNRRIMWVEHSQNGLLYPISSYAFMKEFEHGGLFYGKKPTDPSVSQWIKIIKIGDYTD